MIFWEKKNDFKRKKIKVLKREKKWAFSKGISPWNWSKNRTFSYGRFSQKSYKKTSFLILWKEKNDFKRKKLKFQKGPKKGTVCKGVSPWILTKNRNFFLSLFFTKIMSENIVFRYSRKKTIIFRPKN